MLLELNIKNFAIIEQLNIEFDKGLNVITGETGSGKSIIIDSLGLVLGDRASKDIIKSGEKSTYVEAVFLLDEEEKKSIGVDEDLLIISKEIRMDKPTITRINGRATTASRLNFLKSNLIDIFAQNESTAFYSASKQRKLLDEFAGKNHMDNLVKLKKNQEKIAQLKREIEDKNLDEMSREREIDVLKFQIDEIESANLDEYDEKFLEKDYIKMQNMTSSFENLNKSLNYLSQDFDSVGATDLIDRAIDSLNEIIDYNEGISEDFENLNDISYRLRDIISNIGNYADNLEFDEENFKYLENRLNLVNKLKQKYGRSFEDVKNFLNKSKERLSFLEDYERNLTGLNLKLHELMKKSEELAIIISKRRKEIAKLVQQRINSEIDQLNIKNAKFKIEINEREISEDGMDNVSFYLSSNLGEDYKLLQRVASGGEMSRLMLGFKSMIADLDDIKTLVFDEIDTGISGGTAKIVGKKIKDLANNRQVIAISHLPQIVSLADTHFSISKKSDGNTTSSSVKKLDYEQRMEEIAKLIGGDLTQSNIIAAREMLERGR